MEEELLLLFGGLRFLLRGGLLYFLLFFRRLGLRGILGSERNRDSDEAGENNACFVSLLASCQLAGVEPWSYLRDVFCLLPQWPEHRVLELSPIEWIRTRDRDDVRAQLAANPFRNATLAARV